MDDKTREMLEELKQQHNNMSNLHARVMTQLLDANAPQEVIESLATMFDNYAFAHDQIVPYVTKICQKGDSYAHQN